MSCLTKDCARARLPLRPVLGDAQTSNLSLSLLLIVDAACWFANRNYVNDTSTGSATRPDDMVSGWR